MLVFYLQGYLNMLKLYCWIEWGQIGQSWQHNLCSDEVWCTSMCTWEGSLVGLQLWYIAEQSQVLTSAESKNTILGMYQTGTTRGSSQHTLLHCQPTHVPLRRKLTPTQQFRLLQYLFSDIGPLTQDVICKAWKNIQEHSFIYCK